MRPSASTMWTCHPALDITERPRFLASHQGRASSVDSRLVGSTAALTWHLQRNSKLVRLHAVAPTERPSCAATFARGSLCAMFFNFAMSSAVQRRNVGLGIVSSQSHNKNVKMIRLSKSSKVGRPASLNPLVLCNYSRFRA